MDVGESGELNVEISDHGIGSGNTKRGRASVTFIFGGSVACTISGSTFASTDVPLTVRAPKDCVLDQIPFNVTAGNLRTVQVG